MTHAIEPIGPRPFAPPDGAAGSPPTISLLRLAASVVLIALGAIAIAALLAVLALLALYARFGLEGLTELYQDLRFDPALKTEVGAVVVGTFYVSVAAATIGAARWRDRRGWRQHIAWAPVGGRRGPILGIAAAMLVYAAVTTHLLILSQHRFGVRIIGQTDYVMLGIFAANLVLIAPCAEEIFFRGWLYTNMRQRLAFWPSYLTTTALFAAIHWDAHRPRVLFILPLALALGFVREVTGSIKPTIALHVAYNLIIVTIRLVET